MTITTTLNRIRAHKPCEDGWRKLLAGLGKTAADDEPLPFARIVEINGIDDALWCCRAESQHDREWRMFSVWCARQVQHLMNDPRSIAAIDVAERYANGDATNDELAAAWDAAWAAARAAASAAAQAAAQADARAAARADARAAARDAASAAARDAASAAASAAAWDAWNAAWADARAAARAARPAAWAAQNAARDAAQDARAAARDAQMAHFIEVVS